MIPAVSFAYENPELDIMRRNPRNSKRDHLVTVKLISFSYFQTGIIQTISAFCTFFVVMKDYGFQPKSLYNLLNETGNSPNSKDVYNATLITKGNTNTSGSASATDFTDSSFDFRLYFWKFDADNWSK
jgi:magnesium-transporting ATPase (P-type)